ncbi:SH3 domain-containing protein [Streptomyces sp. NPDC048514]|uniref:SH3 domain-containing protein n=1 Tax=Streptomyces sp. NPDC048514 TaxID=3365564 RepID=UPI00371C0533
MIRRTLQSGLPAMLAALAFLPAAAGAASASTTTMQPVPGAIVRHHHAGAPFRLAATGRVVTRHARLNVRSGPGTGYRVVGHRHARRLVALTCKTPGSAVLGNRTWYRLPHHHGYVSGRYVRLNRALPWC